MTEHPITFAQRFVEMNIVTAKAVTGGLSHPSKMPCPAYSLPATACKTGSRLRNVKGTTCAKCYAYKGNYTWSTTKAALDKRLAAIRHPQWVDGMVYQIAASNCLYFRWHDSGDVQDVQHFSRIVEVAERLPLTKFWLPTLETQVIRQYMLAYNRDALPANLTVRVSAVRIGARRKGLATTTSMVVAKGDTAPEGVHMCPAPQQGNHCGMCRACWDKSVTTVAYMQH